MNSRNQIINMLLNINDQYEQVINQLRAEVAQLKAKYESAEATTPAAQ